MRKVVDKLFMTGETTIAVFPVTNKGRLAGVQYLVRTMVSSKSVPMSFPRRVAADVQRAAQPSRVQLDSLANDKASHEDAKQKASQLDALQPLK